MIDDEVFPDQDPRPDEDAWEAYLEFVLPLMGGSDETGLDNTQLAALEAAIGHPLPFEVGLLLVMGVPAAFPWRHWANDPAGQLASWNDEVANTMNMSADELAAAPPLLPLFANFAVPVVAAVGEDSADANPIVRIESGKVEVAGLDLADWLHKQFDVPLPWWPDNNKRSFPIWSS